MLRATYTCALFKWKIEKAQTMGKMSTWLGGYLKTSPRHLTREATYVYVQIDFDINISEFFNDNFCFLPPHQEPLMNWNSMGFWDLLRLRKKLKTAVPQ